MDINDIRKGVVGIRAKSGLSAGFAGTGFLVENNLILTCAHVLRNADRRGNTLRICFGDPERFYPAEIVFEGDPYEQDVAVLKPSSLPDAPLTPLPLLESSRSAGHAYSTFGYPAEGGGKGIFASGKIEGRERGELQISSNKITHGYSGAPLWDANAGGVVGMVNAGFEFGLDKKLGDVVFAIPAESLKSAFPALQVQAVPAKPLSPTRPGDLPPGSYLPIQPNPYFTGRETELKHLAEALLVESGGVVVNQQALVGMGGIGKTQLAVQFAWQEGHRFAGVHWVSAYRREQADLGVETVIKDSVAQCGREMNLLNWVEGENDIERQVSLTVAAWKQSGPRLVILDNLENLPAADLWMAKLRHTNIRILVTTRQKGWPPAFGLREMTLSAFTQNESLEFLRRSLDESRASDADLEALHRRFGGLPLPLDLAASYLQHVNSLTVSEYLAQLNLEHASLKNWRAAHPTATRHDKDVAASFALSWERVEGESAQTVFRLAGYGLPNEPLLPDVLMAAAGLDEAAFSEALDLLQGLSLLQPEPGLHPLLAEFARLLDGGQDALFRWARALAWRGYPGYEHGGIYHDPALARYIRLSLTDILRATGLTDAEEKERSTLLFHAAFLQAHFGDLDGAMKLYQQSLDIKEGLGDLQGKSATLVNVGVVLFQAGNYADSLKSILTGLDILIQLGAKLDVQSVISLLQQFQQAVGNQEFLALWEQVAAARPLPDWLDLQPDS